MMMTATTLIATTTMTLEQAASADPIDGLCEGKTLLQRLKKMHVSRKFATEP